jgi:hypothetical protein
LREIGRWRESACYTSALSSKYPFRVNPLSIPVGFKRKYKWYRLADPEILLERANLWSITINSTNRVVHFEEIEISENEVTADTDRHRSLSKHRRVSKEKTSSISFYSGPEEGDLTLKVKSVFSLAGPAVMI